MLGLSRYVDLSWFQFTVLACNISDVCLVFEGRKAGKWIIQMNVSYKKRQNYTVLNISMLFLDREGLS